MIFRLSPATRPTTCSRLDRRFSSSFDFERGGIPMKLLRGLGAALVCAVLSWAGPAEAEEQEKGPIKVGILHSLSGTMAISEVSLRDVTLMAIEEINKAGGVLGRQIEPVVVDPASNWPLFAEKAKQLLTQDKVAVVFGCFAFSAKSGQ